MHLKAKKFFLAAGLVAGSCAFLTSAHATQLPPPPYIEAATVAPDVDSPAALVDGVTFNAAVWQNFQLFVRDCMEDEGWSYDMPPVPDWWEPQFDEDGATDAVETFMEPEPLNLAPQSIGNRAYLEVLRGQVIGLAHPDDNGTREFIAHDGINDPFYGSLADDTGGCEALGREHIVEPSIDAQEDVMAEMWGEVQDEVGDPDEITDVDEVVTDLITDPATVSEIEDVLDENTETVLDAGGNYGR